MKTKNKLITTCPAPRHYDQAASEMASDEVTGLKKIFTEKADELARLMAGTKATEIRGANVIRELGLHLELCAGKQKLTAYHFSKIAGSFVDQLPTAGLAFAKFCLAQHYAFPNEITDIHLAGEIWKQARVQLEFLMPGSHGKQQAHVYEPVKDFLAAFSRVGQAYIRLDKDVPVEKWDRFMIESFLRTSGPIEKLCARARECLARSISAPPP